MNREEKEISIAQRAARSFRRIGWLFLVVGCLVCAQPVWALFDPQATIPVGGVPTNDFATKLGAAAFTLMFPVVGGLLVFTPRKKLEAGVIRFNRWAQAFVEGAGR